MTSRRFTGEEADERSIGANIKSLRTLKKLTLQDLADRTGLTKGYLSKVERSEKAPPYGTLNRIAGALESEVTAILSASLPVVDDSHIVIGRKAEEQLLCETNEVTGYDYVVLAGEKRGKNMEPFLIHPPFAMQKMYEHEGEEFAYVLEGTLEFHYGGAVYTLHAGDHAYYDSRIPHSGKSVGQRKAKLLVVIYFYKRNRQ